MICPYCHNDAGQNSICPYCNTILRSPAPADLDRGGFLPVLLGLMVPSIGFVLGFVWRKNKPKSSRNILIASAISTVFCIIASMVLMYAYYAIYLPNLLDSLLI